ncbi:MAG: hypothetical protein KDA20_09930 [Phycisphaerales bacterium]|nr:hypothetical protein [Phycisphaerales bacterium]
MPAIRSRTENWRRSLQQIYERGGALEITLPRYAGEGEDAEGAPSIIWRVRILSLNDQELVLEQPTALGQDFPLEDNVELVGIIAVGQNRWMFPTKFLGKTSVTSGGSRPLAGIRITAPKEVERCQRRNFYRVSTVGIDLPGAEMYPLIDPSTVARAEAANRHAVLGAMVEGESDVAGKIDPAAGESDLPIVGPKCQGVLMNVGGGGLGVMLEGPDAAALGSHHLFWVRLSLPPHVQSPVAAMARLRHTHIDSAQRTYAGLQFEFPSGNEHQQFVIDQLCRYVALVQRDQLKRTNEAA